MESYGFVYIWYDRKNRRFYIGSHWGNEHDGYICSSTWMRNAYNRRPQDFKRRIIERVYTSKIDTFTREQHYLSLIKPEEKKIRYYNIQTSVMHYIESLRDDRRSVRQKISETKKAFWASEDSSELKEEVRAFHKARGTKPPSRKGKSSWNKGLTKETDSRVMNNSLAVSKPKRKYLKPKSEETKQMARDNMKRIWAERKRTTDAK